MSALGAATSARAAGPTAGYPEAVVQWGVQKGETCEDISKALYGSPKHVGLLYRYNRIYCKAGSPLPEGTTLVLPEKVTTLPDAKIGAMNPDVRARPAGGGWGAAAPGQPLYTNSGVNTLDKGRADIQFIDRTRVFLAPNTLVVIYGTASRTQVTRTPPAAVEVESGEVKAGLAALRGDSVEVAIKGGGRVSAASRDTVVERKGERTTVAVFDGRAGVRSGGKSVDVPKNFGTRFVGRKPPVPPRPLPPAPEWQSGGAEAVALAPGGSGIVTAAWKPVPNAISYRVELARDPGFNDLVAREEVPASIQSFRGEQLPAGVYYLHVRAIDKEEYLGVAAERLVRLVAASVDSGGAKIDDREITANPYGVLKLVPTPALEMAIDKSTFGPMPESIDLQRRAPREIVFRPSGGAAATSIAVRYSKVGARIEAARDAGGSIAVTVHMEGFEGVDVRSRVNPSLRVHFPSGVQIVALSGPAGSGALSAIVPLAGSLAPTRIDVVDGRGGVLGTATPSLADTAPPPAPPPVAIPHLGAYVPMWQISPTTDVLWSSPTAPLEAAVSAGTIRARGAWRFQGQVRASGAVGPVGLDAAVRSNATGDTVSDGSAWFGARVRALRIGNAEFELGPLVRIGVPVVSAGAPARLEAGLALGGAAGRFTWLVDLGGRARLRDDGGAAGAPPAQGFLLAGATLDVAPWLRLHALADAHLVRRDSAASEFLGGLGAGIEAGRAVFGSFGFRASPWPDPDAGAFAAQLAIGVRQVGP